MYSYVNKNLPPRTQRRGCGNEEKENRFAILFRDETYMKRDVQLQVIKEKHRAWVQSFRNKLFDGRRFMNRNINENDKYFICSDEDDDDDDDNDDVFKADNRQKHSYKFNSQKSELEQICGMSDSSDNSTTNSIEDDKLNNNCISGLSAIRVQQNNRQNYKPATKPLKSILKKPLTSVNQNYYCAQQPLKTTNNNKTLTTFAANKQQQQQQKNNNFQSPLIINNLSRKSPPKAHTTPASPVSQPKCVNSNNNNTNNNVAAPLLSPQKEVTIGTTTTIAPTEKTANANKKNFCELSDEFLKANCQIILRNIDNCYYGSKQKHLQRYLYDVSKNNSLEKLKSSGILLTKMSSPAECDTTNNNNMGPSILNCSVASSQDFTHDNSDYQWFGSDYFGYRDGVQHHSILSSLSASYSYENMARNFDANVAEVDMENFRTEDILLKIQQQCDDLDNSTISGRKLLLKSQNDFDNSICKSELLFSPVKESHISVDSLDMDGYPDEGDIILTCQANKDNYMITFEGSFSDDSFFGIPNDNDKQNVTFNYGLIAKKAMEASMSRSDTGGFTTWSKLKKTQLQRCPSGNNNNNLTNTSHTTYHPNNNNNNNNVTIRHASNCTAVRKSSSMPNLKANQQLQLQLRQEHDEMANNKPQLNVSHIVSSNSSLTSNKMKTIMPAAITSSNDNDNEKSSSNNEKIQNPPSFNLVKLFIKQKSSSTDTCMDVSSGCWPSDSTNSSTEHPGAHGNANTNSFRNRKKSMNDSGKCSALSRHEEDADECQYDSLDPQINQEKKTNDFNREVFDSPTHKRNYKDYSLNIKNQQLKHPALFNLMNNNSIHSQQNSLKDNSDTSKTSDNITQIHYEDQKTKVNIEMLTKSIQTSTILTSQNKEQQTKSQVQMVPPSFLSRLTKRGSENSSAPVYVIYPNYALPDLEFIKHQPPKIKHDIVISPLDYKEQFSMARTLNLQQPTQRPILKKRPQSLNIEKLRDNEYGHVQDWQSLITLLPRDYRKLLRNVPGINNASLMENSQKPMFCMSPPIRRTNMSVCDCAKLVQQQTPDSSSGSSTQPPSSGYRGSSTLLTDSEVNILNGAGSANDLKNLFVYQYDNLTELSDRPPSGRKGILRRNNTTSNTPPRVGLQQHQKPKRFSMFEQQANAGNPHLNNLSPQQQMQDKRRSLQEPCHPQDLENLLKQNRLPNFYQDEKDLNQLLTELELNRALSNKNPYQTNIDPEMQEIEARLRAENFLNSIPKSELKHYAEIANLMEWTNENRVPTNVDHNRLRSEVSRAISSRKVTFNQQSPLTSPSKAQKQMLNTPNSPAGRKDAAAIQKRLDKDKQDKIQSNQFKRLQIQWEILSNNAQPISSQDKPHERNETKSGSSTPTGGANKLQSKIPRPVSYPSTKHTPEHLATKTNLKSPSRIVPPKRYSTNMASPGSGGTMTSPTTGIPRTPNKVCTTPKKTLPVRSATRTR